jgi:hypothetical protein
MSWMAGSIGSILAVRLLGCTRTCQTVGLNPMYRAAGSDSWTDGDVMAHEHQASREHLAKPGSDEGDPRKGFCGGAIWRPPWPVS